MKTHLRIDHTDDDTYIDLLIEAATQHLDGQYGNLQRALNPQTWELVLSAFPLQDCHGHAWIELPLAAPIITLDSIKYDLEAYEETIDPDLYELDDVSVPARVRSLGTSAWPVADLTVNPVRIRYTAGYAEESGASGVPAAIKHAIKIIVADLYDNRETVTPQNVNKIDIPASADRLLHQYRIHVFA